LFEFALVYIIFLDQFHHDAEEVHVSVRTPCVANRGRVFGTYDVISELDFLHCKGSRKQFAFCISGY